ncbi:unnamed protein product [Spirodela intermedia]|uniref:SET domain-containing protein n=1 Tax=Spirodela intermedia TaxID=51605 RepID=A0A7I8JLP5_SPIIN|nr:unnamed protein product [Spirodela intermedia]CAA6671074.1 unnamed protein product [Spirodela intermedia]
MGECETVRLCLPSLADDDPSSRKRWNLSSELQLRQGLTKEEVLIGLGRLVQCARILLLDEVEIYFVEGDDSGPFSPRNEIESLNLVLSAIDDSFEGTLGVAVEVLKFLKEATLEMIGKIGAQCTDYVISEESNSTVEELLIKWGKEQGVKTKLRIFHFEGAGRGAVASRDLDVGDIALEIPASLIICEELVYESEMFGILKNLDGISSETMMLLWTMKERHNPDSRFKVYFDTLPTEFRTGLSFGIHALAALEGTMLFEELVQAKEHLRHQYDALCPALCADHPNVFQSDMYTWDQFVWACELWYSNSMKIVFSDGKLRTCLVPIAGFLNHSLYPHVTRYGKVDPASDSLRLILSRPCDRGEQCFLSYGSFPSSHLVTFYGFLPRDMHRNPYDVIPLDFEDLVDKEGDQGPGVDGGWSTHMVRGTWLSKSKAPPTTDCRRRCWIISDQAVLEAALSIFSPMLEGIGADDIDRDGASWDVKLALDFVDLQRKIISSVVASSSLALQSLGPL